MSDMNISTIVDTFTVETFLVDTEVVVTSIVGGPPGAPGTDANWVSMTQAEYDALSEKDPETLYVIVPDSSGWAATAGGTVTP